MDNFTTKAFLQDMEYLRQGDENTEISTGVSHWHWTIANEVHDMTQLLLLGKFEYTGGPIFKVVLEC